MFSIVKFLKITTSILIFTFLIPFTFTESLKCLECKNDNDSCTTLIDIKSLQTCEQIDGEDKTKLGCFTKLIGDRNERGCISQKTECPAGDKTCTQCKDDKCNNKPYPETRFKCIQCNGYECADEQKSEKSLPCLQLTKQCYTYNDDTNVIRGCLNDKDKICDPNGKDKDKCKLCDKDSCNGDKENIGFSCYRCRSDIDENCAYANVKGRKPSNCTKEWAKDDTKKCYIERSQYNVVFRGCVVDLIGDSIENCKTDNKVCITCDKSNCNNGKPPPSSAIIIKSIPMIVIVLSILILNLN